MFLYGQLCVAFCVIMAAFAFYILIDCTVSSCGDVFNFTFFSMISIYLVSIYFISMKYLK